MFSEHGEFFVHSTGEAFFESGYFFVKRNLEMISTIEKEIAGGVSFWMLILLIRF
jgi:hypothetical protein